MTDRSTSDRIARDFIAKHEGCKLTTYLDGGGVPTIGFGSTGPHVKMGMTISQRQAEELLLEDMKRFCAAIDRAVKVPLNDNQRAALVSWAFNVGVEAAETSTLVRLLNGGDYGSVPAQLRRWNKDNGKVVRGLVNRREAEVMLWLTEPDTAPAPSKPAPPEALTLIAGIERDLATLKTVLRLA